MSARKAPPITLPGGARHNAKLITRKPQAYVERPSELPEQSIFDQIKETFESFFGAILPVRGAKVDLALAGDPLGITTGEYARRRQVAPTGPTLERIERAGEAGEPYETRQATDKHGKLTGETVTEIVPALKDLKRRGTINDDEYQAAQMFLAHWQKSRFRGPATSKYQQRVDGASGPVYETDRMIYYRQRVHEAIKSVDPLLLPPLAWVLAAMGDAPPVSKIGAYYSPGKGLQTQSSQGAMALRLALASLCRHYGIEHELTEKKINNIVTNFLDAPSNSVVAA